MPFLEVPIYVFMSFEFDLPDARTRPGRQRFVRCSGEKAFRFFGAAREALTIPLNGKIAPPSPTAIQMISFFLTAQ
jgi:hypothetical protein